MKFTFGDLLKPKSDSSREMLIKQQNKFEDLNALMSYELVKEDEGENIYLFDNPDITFSDELFFDAMEKLVEVVRKNTNIQIIRIATPFVEKNYDQLLLAGFSITDVPKDITRFLKISAVARIDREELLKRPMGKLVTK